MNTPQRWAEALSTVEKIARAPFGGVRPQPLHEAGASTLALPKPMSGDGVTLWEALALRRSVREFSAQALPLAQLSSLLWAAAGVNRPDGGRTVPSALAMRAVDVYVALADGLCLYDPGRHELQRTQALDLRRLTGLQGFVDQAPLNLVYVEDTARQHLTGGEAGEHYNFVEAGAMAQNVYLYCAANGLGCVLRALIDRAPLAKAMQLRTPQHILLAQTIGLPASAADLD